MRALILAAGLGTRLRPLTCIRAKPAVPVNGEPLIRRIVARLAAQDIGDVIVNLHHRPATIARVLGDGTDLGVRIRYSWEQPVLGSAGGPRRALPLLVDGDADPRARFLLVNGDTLTDLDLRGLIQAHEDARDAAVTMALIPNPRPDKYGGVRVEGDRITGFSRRGAAGPSYHFIGVQVCEARAFALLPDGEAVESVGDVYPTLLHDEPRAIRAHVSGAVFQDIGTPDDYLRTCLALRTAEGDRLTAGSGVSIHPTATLTDTTVWDDVAVGPGSHLEASIVCDGARVPGGVRYTRSIILPAAGRTPQAGERVEGDLLIAPI